MHVQVLSWELLRRTTTRARKTRQTSPAAMASWTRRVRTASLPARAADFACSRGSIRWLSSSTVSAKSLLVWAISAFNCSGSVMMDAFLHGFNITTDALHRLLGENRRGL